MIIASIHDLISFEVLTKHFIHNNDNESKMVINYASLIEHYFFDLYFKDFLHFKVMNICQSLISDIYNQLQKLNLNLSLINRVSLLIFYLLYEILKKNSNQKKFLH